MGDGEPFDLVVVGAGIAGLAAARRSQQLGARVVVLEKAAGQEGNNTRMSGGRFHAAYMDPRSHHPDELYDKMLDSTDGHARTDVVRAWADSVERSLDFLAAEGATFARTGPPELVWNEIQPSRHSAARKGQVMTWHGYGPDLLVSRIRDAVVAAGGIVHTGARACRLLTAGGAVVGVEYETGPGGGSRQQVEGRAVVLADGGFQGNPDLVRRYVTTHTYRLWCSPLDTGDALQMALELGAQTVEMDAVYGRITLRDTALRPDLADLPAAGLLINAGIVVNGHGDRYMDEACAFEGTPAGDDHGRLAELSDFRNVGAMAKADAPGDSWVVFDDPVWRTTGASAERATFDPRPHAMTLNPTLVERGGTLLRARTLEELAALADLRPARLRSAVEAFNRFCADGTPLDPPRSDREHARAIAEPPFYAIPLVPGVLYTMGGLLVNGHAQVIGAGDEPLPGLYAAGGTMGGLQGGPRLGYSGGWSEASTFGMLAGEHAMAAGAGLGRVLGDGPRA